MASARGLVVFLAVGLAGAAAASGLRSADSPDDEFWMEHHPAINPSSPATHDDLACRPGSVFDGSQCQPCPANTYRAVGMHECKPCAQGTTSDRGAKACTKPAAAAAAAPAAGKGGAPGSGSSGGQQAGAGSPPPSSAEPNHEDLACKPGNVFDGNRCKPCPANTYRAQGMHDCLACPNGKVSSAGAVECSEPTAAPANLPDEEFWRQMHPSNNPSSPANHDDLACKPGSIFSGDTCKPCPANTYRALGMHDCVACPPGQISLPGAVNCFQPADSGSGSGSGAVRAPASPGGEGSEPPVPTPPPGSGSDQSPPPVPVAAAPQVPSAACSPGSVPSPKGDECYMCPSGQFSDDPSTPCTPCPPGFRSSAGAMTCEPCPQGTFAGSQGQAKCTPCGAGFYNSYFGATNASACLPCPAGSHCPAKATHTPVKCGRHERAGSQGSTSCEECPSMFHSNAARTTCRPVAAFYALVASVLAAVAAVGVFVYYRTLSAPVRRSWADAFSPDDLNDGEYGRGYQNMRPSPDELRAGPSGGYGTL